MLRNLFSLAVLLLFFGGPAVLGFVYCRRVWNLSAEKALGSALACLVFSFFFLTTVADLGAAYGSRGWLYGVMALVILPYGAALVLFWKTRNRPPKAEESSRSIEPQSRA